MARITINGKQIQFSTRLEVLPKLWDQKASKTIGKTKEEQWTNQELSILKEEIYKIYFNLLESTEHVTPEKVKNALLREEDEYTLMFQFTEHNKRCKKIENIKITHKTYTRYVLTQKRLQEYLQSNYHEEDIALKKIDTTFIEGFYAFLIMKYRCNNNTAMKFIQSFRTVINYAHNSGLMKVNPFRFFNIHFDKTTCTYLNQEEIDAIWKKKFRTKRLIQVRDMFIFSCYTGLSFIDLVKLKEVTIQMGFDGKI